MRFSANLGMLWTDRPLPEAVRAAHAAGFDAVEFHWPYDTPPARLRAALTDTGLAVISLNAPCGDRAAGEFGIAALADRADEARAGIDEAVAYACGIGARHVHVLAGRTGPGEGPRAALLATLGHAAARAAEAGLGILIEPKNHRDVPDYHLASMADAAAVIAAGPPGIRAIFDCYHLQIMQGDLTRLFARHRAIIGHVQFAGVPDRGEPDRGEIAYDRLLPALAAEGYDGHFGAEYANRLPMDGSLRWMAAMSGGL